MNEAVRIEEFGKAQVVRLEMPGPCGPGDVMVELVASPINPADRLEIQGSYAGTQCPFIGGGEGVARVTDIGPGVANMNVGDLVLSFERQNWQRFRLLESTRLLKLPASIDPLQAAMLRINPCTAHLLLADVLPLESGDWIAFNAGNSSVGRLLATLGAVRGLNMIAVVRDAPLHNDLLACGARAVLGDDDDLPAHVQALTGGAGLRLALDCIAGTASTRMCNALMPGGTLCVYGHLSGDDARIPSRALTFGRKTVRGFNLTQALRRRTHHELAELFTELAGRIRSGEIGTPIAATLPLASFEEAYSQSIRERGSKVLLCPH